MAGRTVRVQGFPAELPPDRAADKLTIHFLRSRNGGGDISNVRVLPGSLPCALITFEAPEVAQRILQVKNHVLAIGKTQYPLEVTPHASELSPNEIFIHVSMTIDYGRLPTGKTLLKDLHKEYSNIHFSFDSKNMQCIVQGPFTELQNFSRDLLGSLNLKNQATGEILLPPSSCGPKEMGMPDQQQVPDSTESAQEAAKLPDCDQVQEMAAKVPSPQSPAGKEAVELLGKLQDFSLAMDSDIYLYMQRFCAAEYQGVLHQHHVDVVDVSGDGIAVLYLQPSGAVAGDTDALRQAQLALQQLYQQLEASLRKEKIAKKGLGMDSQALRALTRELQELYPQLLCHEDVKQLHLVGSLVDVCKAKQFLEDSVTRRGAAHAADTLSSSQPSGTTEAPLLAKPPVYPSATRLSPTKHEQKGEFKLAANFSTLKADRSQAGQDLLVNQDSPPVGQVQLSGKHSSETDAPGQSDPRALSQQYQPPTPMADKVVGSAQPPTPMADKVVGSAQPPTPMTDKVVGSAQPPTPMADKVGSAQPPTPMTDKVVGSAQPPTPMTDKVVGSAQLPTPMADKVVGSAQPPTPMADKVGSAQPPTPMADKVGSAQPPTPMADKVVGSAQLPTLMTDKVVGSAQPPTPMADKVGSAQPPTPMADKVVGSAQLPTPMADKVGSAQLPTPMADKVGSAQLPTPVADKVVGSAAEPQQNDPTEGGHVEGGARLTEEKVLVPVAGKENSTFQHPEDFKGSGPFGYHSLAGLYSNCDVTWTSFALGCKPSAFSPVLRRSNSFSLSRSKESSNSGDISRVSEEISLDTLQWFYLKDVCHAAIDELCRAGGVHITERHAGDCTVLTLQADDTRRLLRAKWKVEDLVQKCPDLVCQSVSYSELAVSGPDDSELSELCSLLRGKSFQVGISKDKYKLYLACPKEMLPGVSEAFHMFSSRRLCAMKSPSLSPGPESAGKSSVMQPSRSPDPVLDVAFPGSLNSPHHLNIINKIDSPHVLRASWLPEAEEKGPPSPWRYQQAWGQEEARGYVDSWASRRGSSLLNLVTGNKPSPPSLREFQEQLKTKLTLGEPDSTWLKQVLPDRFQFARDKSRGGHNGAMGQQHCPVLAADEAPLSLPTWLPRAVAAEPPPAVAQQTPGAEPTDQGRAQLPGGWSNEQEEPELPSQQRRDPSLGQESSTIPLEQCDACQGSGVTCQGSCGHALCRTCFAADSMQPACCDSSSYIPSCNILGTLEISSLSQSLPGFYPDSTLQLTYNIPDGVQGVGDPRPGLPYKGGNFCAFLPENTEGMKIAELLKRAFECGLTFQIKSCNGEERVTWGPIPHKTSWDGGKARNGYPDAQYLHEVGTVLSKLGLV